MNKKEWWNMRDLSKDIKELMGKETSKEVLIKAAGGIFRNISVDNVELLDERIFRNSFTIKMSNVKTDKVSKIFISEEDKELRTSYTIEKINKNKIQSDVIFYYNRDLCLVIEDTFMVDDADKLFTLNDIKMSLFLDLDTDAYESVTMEHVKLYNREFTFNQDPDKRCRVKSFKRKVNIFERAYSDKDTFNIVESLPEMDYYDRYIKYLIERFPDEDINIILLEKIFRITKNSIPYTMTFSKNVFLRLNSKLYKNLLSTDSIYKDPNIVSSSLIKIPITKKEYMSIIML